jgi:hypothetical protein
MISAFSMPINSRDWINSVEKWSNSSKYQYYRAILF